MKNSLAENTKNWRKTKRGLITNLYGKMKSRNTVSFDLDVLHRFADCAKFNRLFDEWESSGYQTEFKPTIDRISNKGHYSIENIQWLSWKENRYKQRMERRNRSLKVAKIYHGKIVKIYKSQRDAISKNNVSQGNLSSALNGIRKKCGGFQWKYIHENPDLL